VAIALSSGRARPAIVLGPVCAILGVALGARLAIAQGAGQPPPADLLPLDLIRQDAALVARLSATPASPVEAARALSLLQTLAARTPWKAAAVAGRTVGQLPQAGDARVAQAQGRLRDIAAAWVSSPRSCAPLRASLERFVDGVEGPISQAPPMNAATAAGACGLPSLAIDPQVRFLTVLTGEGQRGDVLILGPSLIRLGDLPAITVRKRLLYLAAVPVNAPVLVTTSAGAAIPWATYMVVDGDTFTKPPRPSCIDLSRVKTSPGARLFVNGGPVSAGSTGITVLQPEAGADVQVFGADQRRTLHVKVAAARMVDSLACTPVEGDATAAPKETVLLMVTTNGAACADLAVDPLKIRAQVKDMLDRGRTDDGDGSKDTDAGACARYETRGIEVIDALKTITDFQTMLRSFEGGTSSMPQAGNAAVARALRDVGFSIALTLDVRCARLAAGDVQYTVVGQRVDIDRLVEASNSSERELRMDAVGDVLHSQIETQVGDQSLRGLLQATVGRLFQLPYARFEDASATDPRRGNLTFSIEAALPGQSGESVRAEMSALLVAGAGAHDKDCSNIADWNAVRTAERQSAPTPEGRTAWTNHDTTSLRRRADAEGDAGKLAVPGHAPLWLASFQLPFYPVEPGQYVVDITVAPSPGASPSSPALHTYRCVTVSEPAYLAWTEVDQLTGVSTGRAWRNESNSTTYILAGLVRRTSEAFNFGLLAGLGYSRYQADGPSSWTDIARSTGPGRTSMPASGDAVVFGPDGKLELGWSRTSVAIALPFEWRLCRLATLIPPVQETQLRASAFYVKATSLIDVGWYNVQSIPVGLRDIGGGGQQLFDVDGSLLLAFLFKANLADGQTVAVGFHVAWLGFDDFGAQDKRRQARVTYDNWFSYGVHVGFGWHP